MQESAAAAAAEDCKCGDTWHLVTATICCATLYLVRTEDRSEKTRCLVCLKLTESSKSCWMCSHQIQTFYFFFFFLQIQSHSVVMCDLCLLWDLTPSFGSSPSSLTRWVCVTGLPLMIILNWVSVVPVPVEALQLEPPATSLGFCRRRRLHTAAAAPAPAPLQPVTPFHPSSVTWVVPPSVTA